MSKREAYEPAAGVALVTGAAGGIGAAVATELANRGSHLALADRDAEGLASVAQRITAVHPAISVTTYVCDLAERGNALSLTEGVMADHGRLTLLVNNAGVALAGRFEQVSMEDVDWLLDINLRATLGLSSAALPYLGARSHITNVSSLFGIIAPVGNAAYSASKFGVRGFSQALRAELSPRGVGVTVVYPGGIKTSIARNARRGHAVSDDEWHFGQAMFERFLVIDPAAASRRIVEGTIRRRPRVLIGPETYVGDAVARVAPAASTRIFEGLMRVKSRL